jgi:hypothetical protein
VRVSPFVIASSGRPYNITIGRDVNADTVFADRPSFASDSLTPGLVETPWGLLNPAPLPGETTAPRNLGEAPGFFSFNLRVSKSIRLRGVRTATGSPGPGDRGPGDGPGGFGGPPGGGGGGPGGFGGGGRGGFAGRRAESGSNLTLSLYAQNLFNRVNPGAPVGNLSSPSFGESLSSGGGFGRGAGSSAGNRSIELQARVSF